MKAKYIYLMMAGAFLLASCNNEDTPLQAGQDSDAPAMNLPEGTFVVDYTVSTDGAASRSANGMISSLDYLLYESTDGSTYRLTKRVEIPDISTDTAWPLTRANMTWAQREALKDTLNTSNSYKAVFVANAKHDLWDEDVLTGVDDNANFNEARLNLPSKPFDESNMYFMDVVEINENRNQADKSSLNKQILLERVINKIEVKLDDVLTSSDRDAYLIEKLGEFYDANYVKTDNSGELDKVVWSYIKALDDKLTRLGNTDLEANYNATNYFKTTYMQSDDKKKLIVNSISSCNKEECTVENPLCVRQLFIETMMPLFIEACNAWSDVESIQINYEANSYSQAIDFTLSTKNESQEGKTLTAQKEGENSYVFYTFGNNEIGMEQTLNKIKSLVLCYNNDTQTDLSLEVGVIPGNTYTQGNRHFVLAYDPISLMEISTTDNFTYTQSDYNLQTVLGWDWNEDGFEEGWSVSDTNWTTDDTKNWLNKGLDAAGISGTYDEMTLELQIPKVKIVNNWITDEAN